MKHRLFDKRNKIFSVSLSVFVISAIGLGITLMMRYADYDSLKTQNDELRSEKTFAGIKEPIPDVTVDDDMAEGIQEPSILNEYVDLYERNNDLIGWLKINDTLIDYPVMQTMNDEEYYLYRDFDKNENQNGTLFIDTDSDVGTGTAKFDYRDGIAPTTNLIIYGHTMKSGEMFGGLKRYLDKDYGLSRSTISFDTLYEHREYELISVFLSEIYYETDEVFKYYQFFDASTEADFDYWYDNIKELSVYDTGVTAKYGDEFITLSCCSYHTDYGRLVVVGKRVK